MLRFNIHFAWPQTIWRYKMMVKLTLNPRCTCKWRQLNSLQTAHQWFLIDSRDRPPPASRPRPPMSNADLTIYFEKWKYQRVVIGDYPFLTQTETFLNRLFIYYLNCKFTLYKNPKKNQNVWLNTSSNYPKILDIKLTSWLDHDSSTK